MAVLVKFHLSAPVSSFWLEISKPYFITLWITDVGYNQWRCLEVSGHKHQQNFTVSQAGEVLPYGDRPVIANKTNVPRMTPAEGSAVDETEFPQTPLVGPSYAPSIQTPSPLD